MPYDFEMAIYVRNTDLSEVGDPLPGDVLDVVRRLAIAGWWPLDFGECDGEGFEGFTELCFMHGPDIAKDQAEHFLLTECGGQEISWPT